MCILEKTPLISRRRKKSLLRKLKNTIRAPIHVTINLLVNIRDAFQVILGFVGFHPGIRKRRNDAFEKAGRESQRKSRFDLRAELNLHRAHMIREKEIVEQVRFENRMLARNHCSKADEFRENMKSDSLSVSQGSIVNHLAKMQERHANMVDAPSNDQPEE